MKNVRLLSYVAIIFGVMIALLTLLTIVTWNNAKQTNNETENLNSVTTEQVSQITPPNETDIAEESDNQYTFPHLK